MIILITGASHTGKTLLAQRAIERFRYSCLSLDLLKMGLIRSGQTTLTPFDDDLLTDYLWPIVRETVKTALENDQNLIVEGCYIPFDWQKDFDAAALEKIRYVAIVFSEKYVRSHWEDVTGFANVIEKRLDDSYFTPEMAIKDNAVFLEQCEKHRLPYALIENDYHTEIKNVLNGLQ